MLAFLPRIISSLALLWKAVGHSDGRYTEKDSCCSMGPPKVGTPVDVLAVALVIMTNGLPNWNGTESKHDNSQY